MRPSSAPTAACSASRSWVSAPEAVAPSAGRAVTVSGTFLPGGSMTRALSRARCAWCSASSGASVGPRSEYSAMVLLYIQIRFSSAVTARSSVCVWGATGGGPLSTAGPLHALNARNSGNVVGDAASN